MTVKLESVGMRAALPYEKPFPFGTILVPPVRLQGKTLYFRPEGPLQPATGRPDRLVFDFARLATAPERAFVEFARIWGVLGICPHGDSIHHTEPACLPRRAGGEMAESLTRWRNRARRVRSMLNIKSALNRAQPGEPADWRVIWPGSAPTERKAAADVLAAVANIFLGTVNLQPILQQLQNRLTVTFVGGNVVSLMRTMNDHPEIRPWLSSSGTLLAEIAIRTLLVLQDGAGWAICSAPECQRLYRPSRQPPAGRQNFCPKCGKRASWRLSKRRLVGRT